MSSQHVEITITEDSPPMHDSASDHLTVAATVTDHGHTVLVTLIGDLDAESAGAARAEIDAALAKAGTDVVVDASDLAFVDVDGLNLLADVALRVAGQGGSLRLRGTRPLLVRMLRETGLDAVVTVEP